MRPEPGAWELTPWPLCLFVQTFRRKMFTGGVVWVGKWYWEYSH